MARAENEVALVANIGGTHARFGLAGPPRCGKPPIADIRQYFVAEFASLTEAALRYLDDVGGEGRARTGAFAVASAVTGDRIKITNNPWTFSAAAVAKDLGLRDLRIINDFAALSRALPLLGDADVRLIGDAPARPPHPDATYAVVGPGTGLGVGCLALRRGHTTVIESEGGHVSFAPSGRYEAGVMALLHERFARISGERLISGAGLYNLYQAICSIEGVPAGLDSPAAVTAQAAVEPDGPCGRTLTMFCELLGSFAGDAALMFGAWDGVFLAGGVVQKILPWLMAGGFRSRFDAKGRHRSLMEAIPVRAILHSHVELLGAACALGEVSVTPEGMGSAGFGWVNDVIALT